MYLFIIKHNYTLLWYKLQKRRQNDTYTRIQSSSRRAYSSNKNIRTIKLKELWMTPEELEKELGITISAQTRMRAERKIPFYKIGKFIKYNKQEISEWIKSHKVEVIE